MIYNTDFKVKYFDIKEELTWKLKNKTQEEINKNPDPEYEYSSEDVLAICNKLYRDELTNVFYAEDILDDKIDLGIKYVLEKMLLNSDFKQIVNKQVGNLFEKYKLLTMEGKSDADVQNQQMPEEHMAFVFLLMLFDQQHFHLFHKCICQQLTLGTIEQELLEELNKIDL
jgi:hypothetical protein